jgi:hypothetical protein
LGLSTFHVEILPSDGESERNAVASFRLYLPPSLLTKVFPSLRQKIWSARRIAHGARRARRIAHGRSTPPPPSPQKQMLAGSRNQTQKRVNKDVTSLPTSLPTSQMHGSCESSLC